MNSILAHLLQNAVIVAAAVPAVWCFCRWRRHRPAEQHLLWLLLTVKLLLPPLWAFEWPGPLEASPAVMPEAEFVTQTSDELPVIVAAQEVVQPTTAAVAAVPLQQHARTNDQLALVDWSLARLGKMAMACGCILFFAGVLVSTLITLQRICGDLRLVRRSKPAPPELLKYVGAAARSMRSGQVCVRVVDGLAGPVVLWWKQSLLLWPGDMTNAEQRERSAGALMHELAHLQRYDHLVAWLEMLVAIVHWWNPVFWFVRRQLRETRELACDAIALQSGNVSREAYAELLMDLTTGQSFRASPLPIVGMGAVSKCSLKRRIAMIFEPKASGRLTASGVIVAGSLIALLLVTVEPTSGQSGTTPSAALPSVPRNSPNYSPPQNPLAAPRLPSPTVEGPAATAPSGAPSTRTTPELPQFESASLVTVVEAEAPLPQEITEQIRRAVKKIIDDAVKSEDPAAAEKQRQLYEQRIERWLASLGTNQGTFVRQRVVLESHRDTPLEVPSPTPPPSPFIAAPQQVLPPAPSAENGGSFKYDLEIAEITYQEKAVELDALKSELESISAAVESQAAPASELSQAKRKVKLAELALRKAMIEIERLKTGHARVR